MRSPSGGFSRPRFFAGQLLLDEDLAAVESYVAGKNRLHNRFLHGDGVVCGLSVTCDPCGGGKVSVGSGYALDCCGNDILVPCTETLDIPAMVRELRRCLTGTDCGDPCAGTVTDSTETGATATGTPATATAATGTLTGKEIGGGPAGATSGGLQPRRYWLSLRYVEQLSDPTAPYATDDSCAAGECEASRVREGYQFVLSSTRCGCAGEDVLTRLVACVGDPTSFRQHLETSRLAGALGERLQVAARAATGGTVSATAAADFSRDDLTRVREFAAAAGTPDDQAGVRQLVDDLTSAAGLVVAARALDDGAVAGAGLDDPQIEAASAVVKAAAQKLAAPGVATLLDQAAQPFVTAGLRLALRAGEHARGQALTGDLRLLSEGVAADQQLLSTIVDSLRAQKAWLLERADRTGTDCQLAADVAAVRIPAVDSADEGGEEDPEAGAELAAVAARLQALFRRYLLACVSEAINPSCPACSDDTVLLAGVDVLECEVVEICQVVRRYVVSGPGLRFWLPPLNRLPHVLEKLFCDQDQLVRPRPKQDLRDRPVPVERRFLGAPAGPGFGSGLRDELLGALAQVFGDARQAAQALEALGIGATGAVAAPEVDALGPAPSGGPSVDERVTRLETAMDQRLGELDQELTGLRALRASLIGAPPASPAAPPGPAAKSGAATVSPAAKAGPAATGPAATGPAATGPAATGPVKTGPVKTSPAVEKSTPGGRTGETS